MILREIKRILIAPLSWCCVFIYAAIMLVGISNELHYGETGWMDLFHLTENYGIARLAKCLIFPMGAAACYYDERIGHSDWLKMMRSGRFRYCLEKTAVTVLGCVFLYLTSVAVFMIIGSIINPRIVEAQRCGGMMQGGLWEKWANSGNIGQLRFCMCCCMHFRSRYSPCLDCAYLCSVHIVTSSQSFLFFLSVFGFMWEHGFSF